MSEPVITAELNAFARALEALQPLTDLGRQRAISWLAGTFAEEAFDRSKQANTGVDHAA